MLSDDVERYLALRRALGYKLRGVARRLRSFARFAQDRGDIYVRAEAVIAWASAAISPRERDYRIRNVARLAQFLSAEEPAHEIPPTKIFATRARRPAPYIYTDDEIARLLDAAEQLRPQRNNPLRREIYITALGLIAATGLRLSEALGLTFDDVLPGGVLHIRDTKFSKSRLVPMHPTVAAALDRYIERRRRLPATDDHLFLSVRNKPFDPGHFEWTFRRLRSRANIAPDRARQPRIHDLRHTFATRALERCGAERGPIARHFVALSTYLGHSEPKHTYWYLEATPQLMSCIAEAGEALMAQEAA